MDLPPLRRKITIDFNREYLLCHTCDKRTIYGIGYGNEVEVFMRPYCLDCWRWPDFLFVSALWCYEDDETDYQTLSGDYEENLFDEGRFTCMGRRKQLKFRIWKQDEGWTAPSSNELFEIYDYQHKIKNN
jgi:hypothetical protein